MRNEMLHVGLFSIGLDTYWPQFEGLLEKLNGYQQVVHDKLVSKQTKVIHAGMVDTPAKANLAAKLFLQEQVDVVFLFISTYALSHTVLPVAQK
jgi:L-arabinose isomerase